MFWIFFFDNGVFGIPFENKQDAEKMFRIYDLQWEERGIIVLGHTETLISQEQFVKDMKELFAVRQVWIAAK